MVFDLYFLFLFCSCYAQKINIMIKSNVVNFILYLTLIFFQVLLRTDHNCIGVSALAQYYSQVGVDKKKHYLTLQCF